MHGKELTEEEIQNFVISDQNNESINLYQKQKKTLDMHYYIRVVLYHPIDRMFNYNIFKEIKYL
jgi:hypothetical protein